MMTILFW